MAAANLTTFLWFDTEALEAAEFYVSLFPGSRLGAISYYQADAPDELLDERLLAIRNSAYHEAYRLLGVFVSITVVVAIALDISITDSTREFGDPDWTSLSVTVPFMMIWALSSLPSLIIIARQSMED
jgi:hypothetical protein